MADIEILKVNRSKGKATRVEVKVGNIEIYYILLNGKPFEILRKRDGVGVMDTDSLSIPNNDYEAIRRRVSKIFSEIRPAKTLQGRLL